MVAIDAKYLEASDGTGSAVLANITDPRLPGATTLKVNNVDNWPPFFIATSGFVDPNGYITEASKKEFRGHLDGADIIIDGFEAGFTDEGNSNDQIVIIKQTTGWANGVADNIADQNEKIADFIDDYGDWRTLPALVSITPLGNRSYRGVVTGDIRNKINAGMRARTTRATPAPTQSTLLNGTNQYWSKGGTINKMAWVDDFTVSAWVKLTAYGLAGVVVSRYNGTSGWRMYVDSTGQIVFAGNNGGGSNYSWVKSSESLPLNKWVHITAQLDMSAFTATPTTSYIMLNGIDVPAIVERLGTNPTQLIQAGNIEVGSQNGGLSPFPGKIAQVAVFNSKITQATALSYYSQGIIGTETGLASAWSFNGVTTDLNTTTPNDLSSNNGAVATSTDSPFGGQANGTISSTLDYAIIMNVSPTLAGGNTTMIFQAPEGNTIPSLGTLPTLAYSPVSNPYGFPTDKAKWQLTVVNMLQTNLGAGNSGVWYGSSAGIRLTLPIGSFILGYRLASQVTSGSTGYVGVRVALSALTTAPTILDLISKGTTIGAANVEMQSEHSVSDVPVSVDAATNFWAIIIPNITGNICYFSGSSNNFAPIVIRADNAYL